MIGILNIQLKVNFKVVFALAMIMLIDKMKCYSTQSTNNSNVRIMLQLEDF